MVNPDDTQGQRTVALAEAKKPIYAVLAAGEAVVKRMREQLSTLPADTRVELGKLRNRAEDLQKRMGDVDRQTVRRTMDSYWKNARRAYQRLAERGEQIAASRSFSSDSTEENTTNGAPLAPVAPVENDQPKRATRKPAGKRPSREQ